MEVNGKGCQLFYNLVKTFTGAERVCTIKTDTDIGAIHFFDYPDKFSSKQPVMVFKRKRNTPLFKFRFCVFYYGNDISDIWLEIISINCKTQDF